MYLDNIPPFGRKKRMVYICSIRFSLLLFEILNN